MKKIRLTDNQKTMLFWMAKDGDLRPLACSKDARTMRTLEAKGLVTKGAQGWYGITDSGREALR